MVVGGFKEFIKKYGDPISLIGLGIALMGLGVLVVAGDIGLGITGMTTALALVFLGASVMGGLPSSNPIFNKIKISTPILLFATGLIILTIQYQGIEGFINTVISWMLGGLIASGVVVGVQKYLTD